MAEKTSVGLWLTMGLLAIGVAIGVRLVMGSSADTPEIMAEAPDSATSTQTELEAEPRPAHVERATSAPGGELEGGPTFELASKEALPPLTVHHIDSGRRLSLDITSLRAGEVVTLGLALDEKALGGGQDPLSAVVISASDGRRLELSATPVAGPPSGVLLEVVPDWFEPGLYMIQLRTAEKSAFPLRRYVLEIKAELAP